MIIGGKDRNDYRVMDTRALIEEAKYNPNVELCIALAERLEKKQRQIEGYRYDMAAERNAYDAQF